jgi:hypothetical protein
MIAISVMPFLLLMVYAMLWGVPLGTAYPRKEVRPDTKNYKPRKRRGPAQVDGSPLATGRSAQATKT